MLVQGLLVCQIWRGIPSFSRGAAYVPHGHQLLPARPFTSQLLHHTSLCAKPPQHPPQHGVSALQHHEEICVLGVPQSDPKATF